MTRRCGEGRRRRSRGRALGFPTAESVETTERAEDLVEKPNPTTHQGALRAPVRAPLESGHLPVRLVEASTWILRFVRHSRTICPNCTSSHTRSQVASRADLVMQNAEAFAGPALAT